MEMPGIKKNELVFYEGSRLCKCYRVDSCLGEGSFGMVTKCFNTETNQTVAIKVNKSHPQIVRQAVEEIASLKELQRLDPDTCNIVRYNGFFFHKENICINFELLDQSLYEYLRDRHADPLTNAEVTLVIYQMATALSHLKTLGIVHADLKPDNIMLVDRHQQPLQFKLIDFGLAFKCGAQPGVIVQTVCYRAPEVILGLPLHGAIDIWSLGLLAAELVVGHLLYPGVCEYEMLNYILQTQGQLPDDMLDRAGKTEEFFNMLPEGDQKWQLKSEEEFNFVDLRDHNIQSLDDILDFMEQVQGPQPGQHIFMDLVKSMMQLDPDMRIQPLEVLQHPFFWQTFSEMDNKESETQVSLKAEPQIYSGPQAEEGEEVQPKKAKWKGRFGKMFERVVCSFQRLKSNTKNVDVKQRGNY